MPRSNTKLTIEQIEEFLLQTDGADNQTLRAVREFLASELQRRKRAGEMGGKPRIYEGTLKERMRAASAKYRKKEKLK
jgi:hypothetical protein